MNAAKQRSLLRILHLVIGGVVGTYIYSPWGAEPAFALAVKVALIPLLGATGLMMWKQAWLRKALASQSRPQVSR
ncbi:hypothetical protein [Blastomonas sp. UPD001]|uniref:hypothetical protein n=1 Tax=Blastomonas sp. UPD001 TaxID=2217673 RepID=UPI001300B971|nr:hypothetical protein [Blastomonas sp. UPD001]